MSPPAPEELEPPPIAELELIELAPPSPEDDEVDDDEEELHAEA